MASSYAAARSRHIIEDARAAFERLVKGLIDALIKQVAAENPGTVSGVLRSRRAKDGL
jgi:hypothetical protein